MKHHWIEYQQERPECPMTYWVHREADGKHWHEAEEFDPPKQEVVPGRGYPVFKIELNGFTFEFSSLAEIRVCIETFSQKLLPRSIDLWQERGTGCGLDRHWLSRLPKTVKSWKYREKAVVYLHKVLKEFEETIN